MAAPNLSTCEPWATVADVGAPCNTYDFDLALLEDCLVVASDVLYQFTGRQWPGECETTVRPSGYRRPDSCGCLSSATCGCAKPSAIALPGPVVAVTQVKIDGDIIPPERWRVDDYKWLTYLPADGAARHGWPCCQRIDLADTEEDTWSIDYVYGGGPPPGGVDAAAELACQLALARSPDSGKCRLPKRVTNIVRQGVAISVLDPLTLFKDGQTGLSGVDLWVASIMVGAQRRRGSVWRPDTAVKALRRPGT